MGDALGMPLEFGPRRPADDIVLDMRAGRLPAGTFTDDTEMALALVDSLLAHRPLDPADLARRFVVWFRGGPDDVGIHTGTVLSRVAQGEAWDAAASAVQVGRPDSAGNGSVMRCWPVALACWDDLDALLRDSRLQSRVTHPHPECVAASALVNAAIHFLLHGRSPEEAVARALETTDVPPMLRSVVESAPRHNRDELPNSGWVRHTIESAFWGLLTTGSFDQAVIAVANLGNDADTAAAVVGALAGAAYGLDAIPEPWRKVLHGEWPLGRGVCLREEELVALADRLVGEEG